MINLKYYERYLVLYRNFYKNKLGGMTKKIYINIELI